MRWDSLWGAAMEATRRKFPLLIQDTLQLGMVSLLDPSHAMESLPGLPRPHKRGLLFEDHRFLAHVSQDTGRETKLPLTLLRNQGG